MGQGEGLNPCQRVRRLFLRDGEVPDKGKVINWRHSDVTSFEAMLWSIALYAREAPRADPHAGCCGEGGLETRPYPISCFIGKIVAIHF